MVPCSLPFCCFLLRASWQISRSPRPGCPRASAGCLSPQRKSCAKKPLSNREPLRIAGQDEPLQLARQEAVAISVAVAVAVAAVEVLLSVAHGQATLAKEPQQRICCRTRRGPWWQPVKPWRRIPGICPNEPLRVAHKKATAAVAVTDKNVESTRSLCCHARAGAS